MGRRLGLLIATYEYDDTGLRQLRTPAQDAEALAQVLEDPRIAGFEVRVLLNAPTHEVGLAISEFYDGSTRDDLTLLYFTGHGLKDDNGRLYLAMKNTRRDNLRFTGLSAELIDEAMTESPSRQKVLILDCCYSGAYQQRAKSDSAVHTLEKFQGRARTVLTASDSTQYAFEGDTIHGEAAQSVFTRHLVAGLRDGGADLDHDGDITLDELYGYVYDRVTAEQPNQRPKRLDNVEGRTVIAANVNWSLPPHLVAAVNSRIGEDRLAATAALGKLLRSTNPAVRRTAREQLESLAGDDDPEVAETAQARLDAPEPPPQIRTETPMWRDKPEVTVRTALQATARRWGDRIARVGAIQWMSMVAAACMVAAVAFGFADGDWASTYAWYLTAAAIVTAVSAVPLSEAVKAGMTGPAIVGSLWLASWLTRQVSTGGSRPEEPTVVLAVIGHALWIAVGVLSILKLRSEFRWRRPDWILLGLSAIATVALLLVQLDEIYHLRLPLGAVRAIDYLKLPMVLGLLLVELALVGPLLAVLLPPKTRTLFLGSWMVGTVACWVGTHHEGRRIALLVVAGVSWVLLAVWLIRKTKTTETNTTETGTLDRRLRWGALGAVVLPLAICVAFAAVGPTAPRPASVLALAISQDGKTLYGGDWANGTVVRIDTLSGHRIGKPLKVGKSPIRLVLAPDGQRLYVANAATHSVSVVDVPNWKVVGAPIQVADRPSQIVRSPDGQRLYVLSPSTNTLTVVDLANAAVIGGPVGVGSQPSDVETSEDGRRIFVANSDSGTVSVLDAATRKQIGEPLRVGEKPSELLRGPGQRLYVLTNGAVAVIDTGKLSVTPHPVGIVGSRGTLTADGTLLYTLSGKQFVAVDTGSFQVVRRLDVEWSGVVSMIVSADGFRVYSADIYSDGIQVVDTSSNKLIGTIQLPG
jgi:YVTN family beta-propeller protein